MSYRSANIYAGEIFAGVLEEIESGYRFTYDPMYLKSDNVHPISLTLPLQHEPFESNRMFPFFDGLIPEGWLLDVVEQTWKVSPRDRMGLLLVSCRDCIGHIHMRPV
ncbi:MAG: HipA N-terminal domain-containing protein [Bacteroidetes bacterium]|nr:HipA N-terminal domain-containing protein [Bacteroidota bacterium]MCH8524848.1 HipA N-terminal domain-containing protein [Balneolales bacterium]